VPALPASYEHESVLASTSTRGNFPVRTRTLLVLAHASTRGSASTRVFHRICTSTWVLVLALMSTRFDERVLARWGAARRCTHEARVEQISKDYSTLLHVKATIDTSPSPRALARHPAPSHPSCRPSCRSSRHPVIVLLSSSSESSSCQLGLDGLVTVAVTVAVRRPSRAVLLSWPFVGGRGRSWSSESWNWSRPEWSRSVVVVVSRGCGRSW
jgi:hypothetical protein